MNDQQLQALLGRMTLEEKTAQLLQLTGAFYEGFQEKALLTGPMEELGISEEVVNASGSALNLSGAETIMRVQDTYLNQSRLGIPLLFMADIIHGYKTIFPIPLAMGCSWNPELAGQGAEIAAREAAVSGVHVTFGPMADLVRDPRWGRVMESTGEDPYLNSLFARAMVRGYQGSGLPMDTERIAACVKHFAAYGAPEGGREYNTVDMSERQLREYYLPAYRAAVEEGAELVMASFNTVNGIPASGNERLMRGILRKEWGFDGVVISDWASIREMVAHGAAADDKEAALRAIRAGLDIEMMTPCYVHYLPELIREGQVSEAWIDEAVLRILRLKNRLGLFEAPHRAADPVREPAVLLAPEHRRTAYELAVESCVLLKNERSTLPLAPEAKLALIGPYAESRDILGWWSCIGDPADAVPLGEALAGRLGGGQLALASCGIHEVTPQELEGALTAAAGADVLVLALGEAADMSGEGAARTDIRLPQAQLELVRRLAELGKPMAAVLFNGRPLDLTGLYETADAVLEAWFPGTEGGPAIADLLLGRREPSGRLSMSFPRSVGQIPVHYNRYNTGRPYKPGRDEERYVSKYLDCPNDPLLPFGFGLSYTEFRYGELLLDRDRLAADEHLTVRVAVTNTGARPGVETVQLYIRDVAAECVRPVRELKAFTRLVLAPGQSAAAVFTISEEHLRYHHSDLTYSSDPGQFRVYVGGNSRDTREAAFSLV
jgi:beta-glucosidase